MFWKRSAKTPPSVVTLYGLFVWLGRGAWNCKYERKGQQLELMYFGERFDPLLLGRFAHALEHLEQLTREALEASRKDIGMYAHHPEQMKLTGLSVDAGSSDEDVQLDFAFERWPDGGLSVHFKAEEMIGFHIDD